jgi:hypothetical protein
MEEKVRVFFCGSHSVGKTTLSQEILKRFPTFGFLKEVGRSVLHDMNITREDLNIREIRKVYQKNVS